MKGKWFPKRLFRGCSLCSAVFIFWGGVFIDTRLTLWLMWMYVMTIDDHQPSNTFNLPDDSPRRAKGWHVPLRSDILEPWVTTMKQCISTGVSSLFTNKMYKYLINILCLPAIIPKQTTHPHPQHFLPPSQDLFSKEQGPSIAQEIKGRLRAQGPHAGDRELHAPRDRVGLKEERQVGWRHVNPILWHWHLSQV